ncbi:hypothetical protein, partial [Luteimonas huabeiensis]|uniref:hypothetical protein n=1 Tax=Luteimonas huabeiensis TaxID=1244513 RepID=UPI0005BE8780
MSTRHQEQQALLEQLRASGNPALRQRANELQEHYHAREMAGLSHDVYDSARETGTPPSGWV